MLTTERKTALLREAVLNRLPRPGGAPASPTGEEAAFLTEHQDAIDGLVNQVLAAINGKAIELATGRKLFPRRTR